MSYKNFFALLFAISFSLFCYFQFIHTPSQIKETEAPISKKGQSYQKSSYSANISIEPELDLDNNFILISSLITSILSFLGFILSIYHSIKGDRRDEELFSIQKERENLELEKIRAEIEALRGE
jgi:TRAP-type C4-dicarboxylate transport system permease small subunit